MPTIAQRLVVLLANSGGTYSQQVARISPANLIDWSKMAEASGSTAIDSSQLASNGAYTGVTLAQPGFGDGLTAALFDGSTSFNNRYTAARVAAFNGQELSLSGWARIRETGVWGGTDRDLCRFSVDGANFIVVRIDGTNVTLLYMAGGTSEVISSSVLASTFDWFQWGARVSKAGDFAELWINGVMRATASSLGTFAGSIISTQSVVGAQDTSAGLPWKGLIQHWLLWNTCISAADMAIVGTRPSVAGHSAVFFGDSITAGTGSTGPNAYWTNKVAANKGYAPITNSGISSTTLQNTVQNTVTTVGGAAANNGRDTYTTRVTAYAPNWVFILYGLNDLRLNDVAYTSALFQNDLSEVVDGLTATGINANQIVIGSPPYIPAASYSLFAPFDGGDTTKHAAYVAACAAVAAAKGTLYVDVYQWMADNGGDTLMNADGIHPDDDGHQAIANAFLSVL